MVTPRARGTDLPLVLDRSRGALARQLTDGLRRAVRLGPLEAGQRLPSSRELAAALGVGRNIVLEAYETLLAEGYLVGRDRAGTYVATDLPAPEQPASVLAGGPLPASGAEDNHPDRRAPPRWLRRAVAAADVEPRGTPELLDFRVGQTDTAALPLTAWRRAWREVAGQALPSDYADPAGDVSLRAAVAGYLRRARGLSVRAEDVLITAGAVQAVHLVARAILHPGDPVAVEDPGYRLARQILQEAGARLLPLPVDADGLQPAGLPSGPLAPLLVYTTPSHQFPLGVRLSMPRRLALLEWAREQDALIVEDDYDSEFRYGAAPLPALAALERDHVAYVGTFSKVLSPAVRVGYVVAPSALHERLLHLKERLDIHTSWPVQRALAQLIEQGDLERHVRRMRRLYAAKRAALSLGLQPARPHARLMGLEAGLHAHLELAAGLSAAEVVMRARTCGVLVADLAPFYLCPPDRGGLLLGYGGLSLAELAKGARILASVITAVAGNDRTPGRRTSRGP
ncbi:PLP-dependent aminotransferase family protein [Deinococcus navajonensis]|uniref:PLP-dependent aminotransferase family protein n=1 Tax=Deinococcus navajonensis TaxID=309884 RepID=A0ABV8XK26_9DEIO